MMKKYFELLDQIKVSVVLMSLCLVYAGVASPAMAADEVTDQTDQTLVADGTQAPAMDVHPFTKAVWDEGKLIFNVRYRWENVDQNSFTKDANANTVRTRLGYETGLFHGVGLGFDFENVKNIGGRDYNDTVNGHSTYPVIADPNETELNQLFAKINGVVPDTNIKVGRQRIIWDNHRFVGNVGWRQNEQTFDSVRLVNSSLPDTALEYIYIDKVHRIFGDTSTSNGNHAMNSHLFRAKYKGFSWGEITPYGLLIDYRRSAQYTALATASTQTYGARFKGNYKLDDDWKLLYTAEYAHQSDYAETPNDFDVDYVLAEGGVTYSELGWFKGITGKVGYEFLGGDGTRSFQTPLATLHLFEGWTDLFLTTPADGITDLYGSLAATAPYGVKLFTSYHYYESDKGSTEYGKEWQLDALKKFYDGRVLVRATYASFIATPDAASNTKQTGTQKFWFTLGYKY